MTPLPPGAKLGRFEISGVLGEGAMGVVYLAHDLQIERQVAIKTVRAQEAVGLTREETQNRFLKEAKLAGRLQHPNIVTIYEVGRDRDVFFIAMEYVDGEPLTKYLGSRGGFSLAERVEITRQAAQALQHAHERGVLHRDVKPGNILLTREGRVKMADFGIGKLLASGTTELTRTGQLVGSPAYMSPEQIRGQKLDGRSDLFSLGVVFYELLTGSRPFPGDSITTLVYQILHTEPRDPLELRADLPPATREVFARLLAKQPGERPADARAFIAEIRRVESRLRESEPTLRISIPPPAVVPPAVVPPTVPVDPAAPAVATGAKETAKLAESTVATSAPPLPPPPASVSSSSGVAATAAQTAAAFPRRAGPGYLYGIAALLVAAAVLLGIWRYTAREGKEAGSPSRGPSAAATPAAESVPPAAGETPAPLLDAGGTLIATPPETLPTPGPAAAADAIVGAPRYADPSQPAPAPHAAAPAPQIAEGRPAEPLAPPEAPAPREILPPSSSDNVYRTRRFARFGVSPDQARIYVDGRYVGVADDWDDKGGGKEFEFSRDGAHRVLLTLPGYRPLNLDILVTSAAEEETVEIEDELERGSRAPYPKLASVSERTTGAVVFDVDPPNALVAQGGRALGLASSFGPSSPLHLSGPAVHDFVLSAPGRKSKTVRILVAPNAGEDVAKVEEKLKEE